MGHVVLLVLSMAVFFAHAEPVNNPQLEISAVNPQPDSAANNSGENNLLGLPPVPIPVNNPQTPAKIALGDKLFHDKRFSVDGMSPLKKGHLLLK